MRLQGCERVLGLELGLGLGLGLGCGTYCKAGRGLGLGLGCGRYVMGVWEGYDGRDLMGMKRGDEEGCEGI